MNKEYENLAARILAFGTAKGDRTGTGTLSIFGHQSRFNLNEGFPLVTTKKVHFKSIILELLWFIRGGTNATWLQERGCSIWDEWAAPEDVYEDYVVSNYDRAVIAAEKLGVSIQAIQSTLNRKDNESFNGGKNYLEEIGVPETAQRIVKKKGDLGPVYGKQWRSWPAANGETIDQLQQCIDQLKANPDSRRIITSAWNVAELDQMALHPCHAFFQFYSRPIETEERNKLNGTISMTSSELDTLQVPARALSCQLYQRSIDVFLGGPYNIASYAALTHMVAQQTNHFVDEFIWTGGDCHLYSNHIDQVKLQLSREIYEFPKLVLNKKLSINDYALEDFELLNYKHHPAISGKVAV